MCRFLSPLFYCMIVTLLVCDTAFAQRTVPRPPQQKVPSGIIQHYQTTFENSDADNNGKLSVEELERFFENAGDTGKLTKEIVAEKFGDKKELELVDLLHAYAIYSQRDREADWEKDRQIDALQEQVLKRMRQAASQEAQEETAEEAKPDVAEEVRDVYEAVEAEKAETESPHAEFLKRLDLNGDGQLTGEEVERLSPRLRQWLTRAGKIDSEPVPKEVREVSEGSEQIFTEVAENGAKQAKTTDKAETKALQFEIVLLERATREAPARTLAEEALEVAAKGKANSAKLAARIAPLLSAEPNRVTRLVDYLQASATPGGEVMLQKGLNSNQRGMSRGTLVRILPKLSPGGPVDTAITFEKSFVASENILAPREDEAAEDEGEVSEAALKKAEAALMAQLSERERQFLSQVRQREGRSSGESGSQSSPDLETMTAQGSLALTPGKPAVFSEMAGRSENGFHEYVVLVEVTLD